MAQLDTNNLSSLLNEKSGIDSNGFDTIHVVGANSANEAASNISQYKLNYDPNPIVIRKTDPRGPVQYKQKVYVRFLQPPAAPQPGPLIIKEKRAPQPKPLPPLIVRQRQPRAKTPPPLILRELPPEQMLKGGPRYVRVQDPYNAQRYTSHPQDAYNYYQNNGANYQSRYSNVHGQPIDQQDEELIRKVLGKAYDNDVGKPQKWISEVVKH
ncbi:hypothetical protein GJ496_007266 [Pomphorhynchus laevis]|nr:hypothetical protein GJ496_007266 [Pomphorhynchus laevis]